MTVSSLCPICNEEVETLFHYFRDCWQSRNLWCCLRIRNKNDFFRTQNWENWIEQNLKQQSHRDEESAAWHIYFGVVLDTIWRNRNDWVISRKQSLTQASIITIRSQVECIMACNMRSEILKPKATCMSETMVNHWKLPPEGSWKLNCDGSVTSNGHAAGCGGILRDQRGNLMFAFSHRLEACSVLELELWGVYPGISLAWGRGYRKLIVEVDSVEAIELLEMGRSANISIHHLLQGILEIGKDSIEVNWKRIDREFNMVADRLAT